jgi:23S rRNA pseudouridine2605 synthase
MKHRVQKIIAEAGYCSRRNAEELISEGKVFVNGEKIKLGDSADFEKDEIKVNKQVLKPEEKVYISFNKPTGYITTNSDAYDRKKVIDLIDVPQRIFPVGRLDRDASGLLLFTNDGDWANKIMHPKFELEKEYHVKLDGWIDKKAIAAINAGLKLDDGFIRADARMISKNYCSISVHEGRNKVVKRIFKHVGLFVTELKRVRIGPYKLGQSKPGEWKFIKPMKMDIKEIKKPRAPKAALETKTFHRGRQVKTIEPIKHFEKKELERKSVKKAFISKTQYQKQRRAARDEAEGKVFDPTLNKSRKSKTPESDMVVEKPFKFKGKKK